MAAITPQPPQMLANQGQQARELQAFAMPSSLPAQPVAAGPQSEAQIDHGRQMRWRVVCISAVLAVYLVINALLQYIFDMAAMTDVLEKVREVTHMRGGPSATGFLLHGIPSAFMGIMMSLLVPLCGYLGVRQSQKCLLCCFCGCNAFQCCTGIISMVMIIFLTMTIKAATPQVELFLEKCDPMQCQPDILLWENGTHHKGLLPLLTSDKQTLDCLATGEWKEYKPRYSGPHLPSDCPPIFLQCDNQPNHGEVDHEAADEYWDRFSRQKEESETEHGSSQQQRINQLVFGESQAPQQQRETVSAYSVGAPLPVSSQYGPVPVSTTWRCDPSGHCGSFPVAPRIPPTAPSPPTASRSPAGGFEDADAPVRAVGMGDYGAFLSSELPHHESRRLRFAFGKAHHQGKSFFQSHKSPFIGPPMPKDPLTECHVAATAMKRFHEIRLLAPQILPQLEIFLLLRVLLHLPLVALGCLGFCWGKELWERVDEGYTPVGSSHQAQALIMLNPALGISATVPTAESSQMAMAQPLMLSAPPVPAPQVTAISPPSHIPGQVGSQDGAHVQQCVSQPEA